MGVAFYTSKSNKILSFAILWYFGNLIIESSIIPLDIVFEHRTYLPSIMLFAVLVIYLWKYIPSEKVAAVICCIFIAISAFWTYQRNNTLKDPITIHTDSINKSPNKDRPHSNLGTAYRQDGQLEKALKYFKIALKINPTGELNNYNMGAIIQQMGDSKKAMPYYQKAIEINPDFAEPYNNLGVCLIDQNLLQAGLANYRKALKLNPRHPEAPENIRIAQAGLNKINAGIKKIRLLIKHSPENPNLYAQLGYLNFRKGHFIAALLIYNKARSFQPDHIKSLNGLAAIYTHLKQYNRAIDFLKKVAALKPDESYIPYNIACLFSRQKKTVKAIEWLKQAIDKGYNNMNNLKTDKDLNHIRQTPLFNSIINSNF